ncbi:MAG TPA: hypothetical protein VL383_07940 [Gemmatimonadaceae bacterium]|jgi:hypothetical protein|nr:hypothetical protein [Gemmatimonadaceae bacterium]
MRVPLPLVAPRALRWAVGAACLAATGVRAQVVRFGVMEDSARRALRAAWRDDSAQPERAYCVRRARIVARVISPTKIDSIFHVLEVRPAHADAASPNHVSFACHAGTPELHTHTPATCLTDDPQYCAAGGPEAYSCQPSREDYEKLIERGDPFAVIQCDRVAFRFYYPSEYVSPAKDDTVSRRTHRASIAPNNARFITRFSL